MLMLLDAPGLGRSVISVWKFIMAKIRRDTKYLPLVQENNASRYLFTRKLFENNWCWFSKLLLRSELRVKFVNGNSHNDF